MTANPRAFVATMVKLANQNLSEMEPPRWVEWVLWDHPAIGRRIRRALDARWRQA